MSETGIARIVTRCGRQTIYLPSAFRVPGTRVRVRRVAGGILLAPMAMDIKTWFAELDRFADVPFMEDGRRQPPEGLGGEGVNFSLSGRSTRPDCRASRAANRQKRATQDPSRT